MLLSDGCCVVCSCISVDRLFCSVYLSGLVVIGRGVLSRLLLASAVASLHLSSIVMFVIPVEQADRY